MNNNFLQKKIFFMKFLNFLQRFQKVSSRGGGSPSTRRSPSSLSQFDLRHGHFGGQYSGAHLHLPYFFQAFQMCTSIGWYAYINEAYYHFIDNTEHFMHMIELIGQFLAVCMLYIAIKLRKNG